MFIGESSIGSGPNAAHTNVVIGPREGPAGIAFASSLGAPSAGHVPFMTVLQPGVPVKPATLFITKAAIDGELHGNATWGAAQAGLAAGVHKAMTDGTLPPQAADEWVVVAAVWVNPAVDDLDLSFANQRTAAYEAVLAAMNHLPSSSKTAEAAAHISNPFYTPKDDA